MNQFDLITKQFSQQKIIERVDNKTDQIFTPRPFRARAYPIFVLALVVTGACQLASGFTEVYMLWNWLSGINVYFAIVLVGVIALAIEIPKRWGATEVMVNKTVLGLSLLVATQVASVYISYNGAKTLPKEVHVKPVLSSPTLIDIDSLNKALDAAVLAKTVEIEQYFERFKKRNQATGGWRLSSSKDVRGPYNEMLATKKTLEGQKISEPKAAEDKNTKALEKAEKEYKEAMVIYNQKLVDDGNLYGWVSLGIEALFLLAFGVMAYFLRRSDDEKNAHKNVTSQTNVTDERSINTTVHPNERSNGTQNETPQHVTLVASQKTKPATFKDFNSTYTIKCQTCGTAVNTTKENTKYCSSKCRSKAYRLRNQSK